MNNQKLISVRVLKEQPPLEDSYRFDYWRQKYRKINEDIESFENQVFNNIVPE